MNSNITDFTKSIISEDGFPTIPTVIFTEDDWTTFYTGYCIEKSTYSYLIESSEYGRRWIPIENVKLKQ